MKRRTLKKNINYLVQELIAECLWISHSQKNTNLRDAENVLDNILLLQREVLSRVSHQGTQSGKVYFRQLRKEFIVRVEEIIGQIKTLA